jgi:hypothetical protein
MEQMRSHKNSGYCPFNATLKVKLNFRSMSPASIHYYNDWSSLNYMYGVVNISYHEDAKVKIKKRRRNSLEYGVRCVSRCTLKGPSFYWQHIF